MTLSCPRNRQLNMKVLFIFSKKSDNISISPFIIQHYKIATPIDCCNDPLDFVISTVNESDSFRTGLISLSSSPLCQGFEETFTFSM